MGGCDVGRILLVMVVSTVGFSAAAAEWSLEPDQDALEQAGGRILGHLEVEDLEGTRFVRLGAKAAVILRTKGLFNPRQGTIRFRVRPAWSGDDGQAHAFFHLGDSNAHVTIFKTDTGLLRFAYKASPSQYSACDTSVTNWKANEIHEISAGWVQNYSGDILLQLTLDGTRVLKGGASALDAVPEQMFVGRRGMQAQPAEAWIGDFRLGDSRPELPYATGPKQPLTAHVDCSHAQPARPVHDFTTIWNSRDNPLPFGVGDPEYDRFVDARFRMVRLVAFSEGWLWGTRVELDKHGQLVTDFTDFDRLLDVFNTAGAEPYIRLAYHTPAALIDPKLPRNQRAYALPQDLGQWDELMERIVRHVRFERNLPVRYWVTALNEGDIPVRRGQAQPETIYQLYGRTAKLVKRLDPQARVGGPALAWSIEGENRPATMLVDFLKYCRQHDLPLDFLCFHGYHKAHPREYEKLVQVVRSAVQDHWPEKVGRVEYFLDEWNLWNRDRLQDNEYGAAYLAAALHYQRRAKLTKSSIVSFNHFKQVDSATAGARREGGQFVYNDQAIAQFTGLPLIKGPVVTTPYFVWLMHARLGEREWTVDLPGVDGIVDDDSGGLTATADNDRIALLFWHFDLLRNTPRRWKVQLDKLPPTLRNAKSLQLTEYRIDHGHNNPYTKYVLEQADSNHGRYNLETAVLEPFRRERIEPANGQVELQLEMPNMSVVLLELKAE